MNKHVIVSVSCVIFSGEQVFSKQRDQSKFMFLLFLVIANDMFKRKGKKKVWPKGKKNIQDFYDKCFWKQWVIVVQIPLQWNKVKIKEMLCFKIFPGGQC